MEATRADFDPERLGNDVFHGIDEHSASKADKPARTAPAPVADPFGTISFSQANRAVAGNVKKVHND